MQPYAPLPTEWEMIQQQNKAGEKKKTCVAGKACPMMNAAVVPGAQRYQASAAGVPYSPCMQLSCLRFDLGHANDMQAKHAYLARSGAIDALGKTFPSGSHGKKGEALHLRLRNGFGASLFRRGLPPGHKSVTTLRDVRGQASTF